MTTTNETEKGFWNYAAIIGALITIAVIGLRTMSESDVWMHLANGRAIAEQGIQRTDTFSWSRANTSWVNTTWLYDWFLYHVWQIGGAPLATLLNTLMVLGAFSLLLPVTRRWATGTATALSLLLCGWILAPVFTLSPSIFSLLFPALFIALFSGKMKPAAAIPILLSSQLLWTNMNPSFLWGPVICAVFLAQNYFSKGRKGKTLAASLKFSTLLTLTVADVLITLVNPYLTDLHANVMTMLSSRSLQYVVSWISPFSDQFAPSLLRYLPIFALAIGACGLVMQKEKLPIAITALAVLSAFFVVRSLQFSALFSVLSLPFLAMSLYAIGETLADKSAKNALVPAWAGQSAVLLLAIVSITLFATNAYYARFGHPCSFGLGVAEHAFPSHTAIETLVQENMPSNTVNTIQDGGYLTWTIPSRKTFADSRATLYSTDFYSELVAGLNGGSWKEFSEKWKPECVILNTTYRQAALSAKMLAFNGWALIYFDGISAIYLPRIPINQALIENKELKKKGLSILSDRISAYRHQLGGIAAQPPPADLIGAGSLLLANGNFKQAFGIFALLTRGSPKMAGAWLNLGRCQLELGETEKALASLLEAIRLSPKNSIAWLNASLAYEKLGDAEQAAEAMEQVRKYNAELADAFMKSKTTETNVLEASDSESI